MGIREMQAKMREIDREIAEQNAKKEEAKMSDTDRLARLRSSDPEDMRQRIEDLARDRLPAEAERLAARENIDYSTAVRKLVSEDSAFERLPGTPYSPDEADMRSAVEERIRSYEDQGTATAGRAEDDREAAIREHMESNRENYA